MPLPIRAIFGRCLVAVSVLSVVVDVKKLALLGEQKNDCAKKIVGRGLKRAIGDDAVWLVALLFWLCCCCYSPSQYEERRYDRRPGRRGKEGYVERW